MVIQLPRAGFFGPASINGKKPDKKAYGMKGGFRMLTPAVYAGAAVIVSTVSSS